jgi:Holliday junction DNA helicase RuvA
MIAFLKGRIIDLNKEKVIIETNNIGYEVIINQQVYQNIFNKTEAELSIQFIKREDGDYLFGFNDFNERNYFNILLKAQGVGPKTASNILGILGSKKLCESILNNQSDVLCTIPGIGKKTAEKLILDLKDKIKNISSTDSLDTIVVQNHIPSAVDALVSLGFNRYKSENTVLKVVALKPDIKNDLQVMIKESLKIINSKK